jgi:hypothetical protein
VALVLVLSGCASFDPVFRPDPWDDYGDAGPLAVRGASRSAPGPTIVEALRREPKLAAVFSRYGEPDSLEVLGSRYQSKDIVLVYKRSGDRILVEHSDDGWVARAPEALPGRTRRVAVPARTVSTAPPAARPTMAQSLECPIDPSRADCRALCAAGTKHEWCP